jgi:hypothetical protein
MALDISIDPNTLQSIRNLVETLRDTFEVDFLPEFLSSLDETLPLRGATFVADRNKQQYELGILFGVKVSEDSEGEAQHLDVGLNIVIKPNKGPGVGRQTEYGALVEIPLSGGVTRLSFEGYISSKARTMLIAQCSLTAEQPLPLQDMVGGVAPAMAVLIPEGLSIPLRGNLFLVLARGAGAGAGAGRRLMLGVGFHAGINLGEIPLVGLYFGEGQTSGAITLELLLATHAFTHQEIKALNAITEELNSPFRFRIRPSSSTQQGLERGAFLVGYLAAGDLKRTWYMPLRRSGSGHPRALLSGEGHRGHLPRSTQDDSPITVSPNGAWLSVERSVGPVHLQKLGLVYKDGAAHFVPEIVLSVGDLRLILDGVSIRLPLPSGSVGFQMDGFGLEYSNKTLSIGGAFLRSQRGGYEEYAGMATIQLRGGKMGGKVASIGLAAVGAYAYVDGQPSLFLYATLNAPLGGPPFLFVTGVSAGFGYNRSLATPALENVPAFPLVHQAMQGTGNTSTEDPGLVVAGQLRDLSSHIRVDPGTGFLAVGLRFTSFKLLDSFALLTLQLGKSFELGLLGLSRFQVPPAPAKALVVVEMVQQARLAPDEGIVLLRGQLTSASYLFSPSCQLTGGYAFATWFAGDHAGDFVVTLGGYHPSFRAPSHYPTVPRVGLNWRLGSTLSLRGEVYLALCSHAVMAGGYLQAQFKAGPAWADFRLGADFLICWRPYCYQLGVYVHFKFGLGPLKASLGAQLQLWGPDFAGYAKLKVILFSVKVKFGDQSSPLPKPIPWNEFRSSFLPADNNEVCNIAVAEGLVRQVRGSSDDEALWIVNRQQFALETDSIIPCKQAHHPASSSPVTGPDFGVSPVGVQARETVSEHRVSVKYNGFPVAPDKFRFTDLRRRAPAALWGDPQVFSGIFGGELLAFPSVNGTQYVEDALVGLRMEPAQPPRGGDTDDLPVELLQFDPSILRNVYGFEPLPAFHGSSASDDERRAAIRSTLVSHSVRNDLLKALGFKPDEDVSLEGGVVDAFVFAPQVKQAA